ncbi:MAG: hypothetical protein QOG62_2208 [Thermoleophilaceae bacterium]|jgi:hypothetical protein|nr:hypothetical protein [Thermoleophilaceae bacterium]
MSVTRPVLQYTVLAMSVIAVLHDVVALIVNPSFAIGADAQTVKFLWVDYNGWHAVLGLLIFLPGLYVWRRADWAQLYALAIVFGLMSTAIWGLLETNPLGVLSLPDQRADAIFHVGVAGVYVLALALQGLRDTPRGAST